MTTDLPRVKITDPPVPLPEDIKFSPFRILSDGKIHREARIPWRGVDFTPIWKRHKMAFMERGFWMRQHDGIWWLEQWLTGRPGDRRLTERGLEMLDNIKARIKQASHPAMEVPAEFILPELPNGLEGKLFDYQRQPARQLYRALCNGKKEWGFACAWDGSDTGTGKTFTSLAAAIATGKRIGVVCPKSVIGTHTSGTGWHGAFRHFGVKPEFVINYESLIRGRAGIINLTGNESRRFEWEPDPDNVMILWDESHKLKNNSIVRKTGLSAFRQGFSQIFISATMAESPLNLYVTGMAVGLHRGDLASYEAFLRGHGCRKNGSTWTFEKNQGSFALARIHNTVYPRRGVRIRIKELGDKFPSNQTMCEAIETDDTAGVAKAYDEAKAILAMMRLQGKSEGQIQLAESAAYMAARKKSEIAKVPALIERAKAEMAEGRSVAFFLCFTEARERLMRELNTDCGIFGGQSADQRNEAIRRFQSDESRIIVVMSQAGGTGVSLHDINGKHPRTALICPDNNAVTLGQVLGRIHRAGGKSLSRQVICYAVGTLEEDICDNVRIKLRNIASINDGDLNPESKF